MLLKFNLYFFRLFFLFYLCWIKNIDMFKVAFYNCNLIPTDPNEKYMWKWMITDGKYKIVYTFFLHNKNFLTMLQVNTFSHGCSVMKGKIKVSFKFENKILFFPHSIYLLNFISDFSDDTISSFVCKSFCFFGWRGVFKKVIRFNLIQFSHK